MNQRPVSPALRATLLAATLAAAFNLAHAAPTVSHLTPPSNPTLDTATTLARFLPGQRFDLQATLQSSADTSIASVNFAVDGVTVARMAHDGTPANQYAAHTGLVKTSLVSGLAAGTVVASVRAYANSRPGLHALKVTVTDSAGQTSTRIGNFEVVAINVGNGRRAKNIIFMLGDGMGAAHRTAARTMAKGHLQGKKAQDRLAMDSFPFTGMVMTSR